MPDVPAVHAQIAAEIDPDGAEHDDRPGQHPAGRRRHAGVRLLEDDEERVEDAEAQDRVAEAERVSTRVWMMSYQSGTGVSAVRWLKLSSVMR